MSYTLRLIFIVLGIEFAGFYILTSLGYESLTMPFAGLFLLGMFLMPSSWGKPRFVPHRDNQPIPAKFKQFEDELLALGFERDCLMVVTHFFMPTKQWIYRNREEHVEAYINESTGRLWFSSYFEKNFDVTTRFKHGEVLNNKKMVSEIVKTSIPATFDYHLQSRQKYSHQYGAIMLFESAEQQIEWELKLNVESEINKEAGIGVFKTLWRGFVAFVVMILVGVVMGIAVMMYWGYTMPESLEDAFLLWGQWYSGISFILIMAYAMWPTIFPQTVEDRKGKKQG